MTNDEAIYILQNAKGLAWMGRTGRVSEAVQMAVEALKQPGIMSDGTLHIIIDADVSTIERILLSQKETHWVGDVYYRRANNNER